MDDKSKFIEMKGLREHYENQIKNIKKGWERQVKKLVSIYVIELKIDETSLIFLLKTNDIGTKNRKLKTSEDKIIDLVTKRPNPTIKSKVSFHNIVFSHIC